MNWHLDVHAAAISRDLHDVTAATRMEVAHLTAVTVTLVFAVGLALAVGYLGTAARGRSPR